MKKVVVFAMLFQIGLSNVFAQTEKLMTDVEYDAFKVRALEKVNELKSYIITITDKKINDQDLKINAIELAVKLFESESNLIEVSSKSTGKVTKYKVREYLNRLRVLQYSKVEITWFDISYVSDFVRDEDGNYRGVIAIFQKFKGYIENRLVYEDITVRNMGVTIKNEEKFMGDRKVEYREVLLGDISVIETR
jgi:hypothetical protein